LPYTDFTQMSVWKLANEIVKDVYKLTEKLPRREDYALCGQLRRAAVSIAGNIAEGFGRAHTKDKAHFYLYSRGSSFEVRSHLYSGVTVEYFNTDEIKPIDEKCKSVIEELNKILKGLKTAFAQP
jgi:four helix bundle protein